MWKFLFLFVFLSADAQRFKLNLDEKARESLEITEFTSPKVTNDEFSTYRLPNDTRPESYLINMNFGDFHQGDLSFTGNVRIVIKVVEETSRIVLHSAVNIAEISLRKFSGDDQTIIPIVSIVSNEEREFIVITTREVLIEGSVLQLTINYQGTIGTAISGVYRGSYRENGIEKCV